MRLTGSAAEEFFTDLCANEAQLRHMADEEDALQGKVSWAIFVEMVKFHHEQKLKTFGRGCA